MENYQQLSALPNSALLVDHLALFFLSYWISVSEYRMYLKARFHSILPLWTLFSYVRFVSDSRAVLTETQCHMHLGVKVSFSS